jgi:16S rRNA (cytidine1402-2'-O)-methyltransferase
LVEHLGPDRIVFVGRELTKIYEEGVRGSASDIKAYYAQHPEKIRGEFVVVISGLV